METPAPLPPRSPACAALIGRVAAGIEHRIAPIAAGLIDRVIAELGFDPGDAELHEDLIAAAEGSVGLITSMAHAWSDPRIVPPPRDALLWARSLVARDVPAYALIRVYRVGQADYTQLWIAELAASGEPPEVILEAISAVTAFVFSWVDAIMAPLLDAYDDELSRRLRGVEAVRAETIALALSDQPFDAAAASARLRYTLDREHLAVLCWVEPGRPEDDRAGLEAVAETLAGQLGPASSVPLVHRDTPGSVVAWVPRVRLSAAAAGRLARAAGAHDVQVAVGRPGEGPGGFRATYDTARRARRVTRLLHPGQTLTVFADVAVLDLATRDLDAARALAASTLGPLAVATDARAARLIATLRVFFAEGQSYARVSRRLRIHENTIADRVRRALDLTGFAAGQDLSALRLAVELAPLLGVETVPVPGGLR